MQRASTNIRNGGEHHGVSERSHVCGVRWPRTAIAVLVVGAIVGFLAILLLLFVGILAINGRARRSANGAVKHDSFDICCHLVKSSDSDREKEENDLKHTAGETAVHVGIDLRPSDTEKSRFFTYKELAAATNNFSDRHKIGDGGYCAVYRGLLQGKAFHDSGPNFGSQGQNAQVKKRPSC
ncbi:hypothetical protein CBR_g30403 [Chara braunii]|uniref:Protein kinase domain-containing protein n=1 Tax=Chara braunii TaxID=69332 RepID=A0A388LCL7_CHABU|nr:hypothetical protein CBR_g30403 [Chara braunii]|eukprot:GBG80034.1 hypothetical protein CBR_g30403 [Chara braunii]